MRPLFALVWLTGAARADDRAPAVSVGFSVISHIIHHDSLDHEERVETGPLAVVSWEDPPLAYSAEPGHRLSLTLVPELIGGMLRGDQPTEIVFGAGLRPELKWAQREGGWMRLTCRGSVYVAARGLVIGEHRDPLFEGVFGEYFQTQLGLRIGFELGMVGRAWSHETDVDRAGFTAQFFVGWGQGGSPLR